MESAAKSIEAGDAQASEDAPSVPVELDLPEASRIASGAQHTCVILSTDEVKCWGANDWGRRGKLEEFDSAPVDVPVPAGVIRVIVGETHFCTLLDSKTVRCGSEQDEFTWLSEVTDFSSDIDSKCASLTSGEVLCMDGYSYLTPHRIAGIEEAVGVSARRAHTCALETSGRVGCWGGNWHS